MNAKETLNLISKQWATTDDIKQLANCGNNKASEIKKTIVCELEQKGYYLPKRLIPMDKLVDYLNININYLKKVKGD